MKSTLRHCANCFHCRIKAERIWCAEGVWVTQKGKEFEEHSINWVIYPRNERLEKIAANCGKFHPMDGGA